jgi:flagellar hook protein FlgE
MSTGMFAAVSGIRANQTRLNVISNNIANVNTTGFKSSAANFATVFSSTISGGTGSNGSLGGTNPIQIGNGSLLSDINSNFSQGGTQYTGRSTDMMINGNGFFAVEHINPNNGSNSSDYYLTRAGNFSLDDSGNLVTAAGNRLRGTAAISGSDPTTLGRVQIPQSFLITKDLDVNGGTVAMHFSPIGTDPSPGGPIDSAIDPSAVSQLTVPVNLVSFSIGVDGAIAAKYSNGDTITVRTDEFTTTSFPTDPTQWRRELIIRPAEGGTFASSTMLTTDKGFVDEVGATAVFDGGVGLAVGAGGLQGMQLQLQTASVSNPNGLLYDGNSNFLSAANSGTTNFGIANSGSVGNINSGALESSNVDIAGEFTNLMITQRGLEAASKVVRTQSEVMQTIIQMMS